MVCQLAGSPRLYLQLRSTPLGYFGRPSVGGHHLDFYWVLFRWHVVPAPRANDSDLRATEGQVAGYPHTLFPRTGHPANNSQPERIGRWKSSESATSDANSTRLPTR